MIWNKQAECMPDKELRKLQLERLKETSGGLMRIALYKKKFDD